MGNIYSPIIADKLYDQIERKVRCELQPIAKNTTILVVDGTPLKVKRSGKVNSLFNSDLMSFVAKL